MKVHLAPKAAVTQSSAGPPVSKPAKGESMQSPEPEIEEPVAAEDREDPGTDVAPSRFDVSIDPHAPTRTTSPQGGELPDEDRPEAVDFD